MLLVNENKGQKRAGKSLLLVNNSNAAFRIVSLTSIMPEVSNTIHVKEIRKVCFFVDANCTKFKLFSQILLVTAGMFVSDGGINKAIPN